MSARLAWTLVALVSSVAAHGFIKEVTVNGQTSKAQKTDFHQSSFRSVSDNTGWIGSNFFSSDCSVCGCSNTPFGRVASPDGTVFSTAGQSAGQTPSTAAGSTITLHVAGNPGQGWPHPNGHLQAYLGAVGDTQNLDVKNVQFFKIQGQKNGVPALRAAFDKGADSNPWNIQIPKAVKSGKYILRSEIWAYGQSSQAEGGQVQLYPFCMNLEVTNGGNANPGTVTFPGTNANDKNIVSQGLSYLPGPQINAAFGGSGTDVGAPSTSTPGSNGGSTGNKGGSTPAPAPVPAPAPAPKAGKKGTSSKCKAPKKHKKHGHRRHHAHRHAS